jgi:amino acid transporter
MASLRRELGPRDLTLMAIVMIAGPRWIPAAAHGGPGSILLWLFASLFLLIPLAVAVAALTAKDPSAGGMYVWTRKDFGPWHGFLCFWVYWMAMVIWVPSTAMFYAAAAVSTAGPHFAWLANDRAYLIAASLLVIWVSQGANIVGMKTGKWTQNGGAIAGWLLIGTLLVLAALMWRRGGPATPFHLLPELSWGTVNSWASIAYGVTGFELVGMMGAEIRDPGRSIRRAAWFSSVGVTLFFGDGTASMLVIQRPEGFTEMNGFGQVAATAGAALGAGWVASPIAFLVLGAAVGQFGGIGTSLARMPFAAGVDHLLPPLFAKVHPRWATPYVSIAAFGAIASALLILIQLGDTARAAYETLVSLMVIVGFLPFIYLFGSSWKAGRRLSALTGWAVTLLAIVCSLAPPPEVRVWIFEAKLAAGTAAVVGSAFLVYRRQVSRAV